MQGCGERFTGMGFGYLAAGLPLLTALSAVICGFDDGQLCMWRLFDRQRIVVYEPAPAPVVCLAVTEAHLLVGTSRAELLMYFPPPHLSGSGAGVRVLSPTFGASQPAS